MKKQKQAMPQRPSWDDYFLEIAKTVALRSTCPRLNVGAIITKNNMILSTGYNGSPRDQPHCIDEGCIIVRREDEPGVLKDHCMRVLHAEQNALIQAALAGRSPKGGTIYITHEICSVCANMLVQAGVKRAVFGRPYRDMLATNILKSAGIELVNYGQVTKLTELKI